jgi:hypothetical protein
LYVFNFFLIFLFFHWFRQERIHWHPKPESFGRVVAFFASSGILAHNTQHGANNINQIVYQSVSLFHT